MQYERSGAESSAFGFWLRPVLAGLVGGIAAVLVLLLVFSAAVSFGGLSSSSFFSLAMAACIAGAFFAGFIGARKASCRGALFGAIGGAVLFLLLTLVALLVSGETPGSVTLIRLVAMPVSGAIGGILGVNLKKR